jgi:hypothetical protein
MRHSVRAHVACSTPAGPANAEKGVQLTLANYPAYVAYDCLGDSR